MLLQFDILGFVETRISNQTAESFKIDGFKLFCSEYEQSSHEPRSGGSVVSVTDS